MNGDQMLDELDGRLTAITVKYPDARLFIWSFHKHVRYALMNPGRIRVWKLAKKGRKWLNAMMWKHPIFRPEFEKMIAVIDKAEKGE